MCALFYLKFLFFVFVFGLLKAKPKQNKAN